MVTAAARVIAGGDAGDSHMICYSNRPRHIHMILHKVWGTCHLLIEFVVAKSNNIPKITAAIGHHRSLWTNVIIFNAVDC